MKTPKRDRLADLFFDSLENERNVSPRTLVNYRHALVRFREAMPEPAWRELTADHFRRYLFACSKREMARPTIRLHFAALRTFFKFLTQRHGLRDNPLREVQLPKLEKKLPHFLNAQQIDALLAAPLELDAPADYYSEPATPEPPSRWTLYFVYFVFALAVLLFLVLSLGWFRAIAEAIFSAMGKPWK